MRKLIPIVLSGGSGQRLWPISSKENPKQFIKLFSGKSLFDMTLERAKFLTNIPPVIIASKENKKNILSSINFLNSKPKIIYEEIGRNTTAAIIFGLKQVIEEHPNSNIIIMPSDHLISNKNEFSNSINNLLNNIEKFKWFLLGVKPTFPSIGYGYIKAKGSKKIKEIEFFIEKPLKQKAEKLILSSNIFWNSGIFIGNTDNILSSIKEHASDIFSQCELTWKNRNILENEVFLSKKYLEKIRSESIDISVLEKEKSKALSSINTDWSDVGSWDMLSKTDFDASSINNVLEFNSENNFIINDNKLTVAIGVKDLIIVNHKDTTLIVKKGESEKIKEIFNQIVEFKK